MRERKKNAVKPEFSRRLLLKAAAVGMFGLILSPMAGLARRACAAVSGAGGKKVLVVYYSRSGNTRNMANQIHARVGGDIVELQTVHPYPEEYRATTEQAKKELQSGFKPALKTQVENIGTYDIVFVGSPNWWSTMASPVWTFLSDYDLSGKTLVPFITHEGSGLGKSVSDLKSLCPNSTILEGLAVRGSAVGNSGSKIAEWLRTIGMAN